VPLPPMQVSFVEDPTERFHMQPYRAAVDEYMRDEVLPYVPEAWADHDKTRIGYEIPLTRHFYRYVPPRPLEEIKGEVADMDKDILRMLRRVVGGGGLRD